MGGEPKRKYQPTLFSMKVKGNRPSILRADQYFLFVGLCAEMPLAADTELDTTITHMQSHVVNQVDFWH